MKNADYYHNLGKNACKEVFLRKYTPRISYNISSYTLLNIAIKNFSKAIELRDKECAEDYFWRGKVYYYKEDYEAAIKDFTKAIELREDAVNYHWRALSHKMNGNPNAAMKDINRALRIDPDFAEAKELKGEIIGNGLEIS